jgi:hypothetical protein
MVYQSVTKPMFHIFLLLEHFQMLFFIFFRLLVINEYEEAHVKLVVDSSFSSLSEK